MQKGKEQLISEIKEAFKGVELGDGIGLSEANAIDYYSDERFRSECRQNDEKLHWNTIPTADLNKYNSSLSFFDAKGMQFHLPAFLIADIKGQYNFNMVYTLTNLSDYSKSQFESLSIPQRAATRSFLEYILEFPNFELERLEIKEAIETYWAA